MRIYEARQAFRASLGQKQLFKIRFSQKPCKFMLFRYTRRAYQKGCVSLLDEMSKIIDGNFGDYYTIAIDNLARKGTRVGFIDVKDHVWREIDTEEEYDELVSIYSTLV